MGLKSNKCCSKASLSNNSHPAKTRLYLRGVRMNGILWILVLSIGYVCYSKAYADAVAVPVHSLPHPCNVHGFPQVMESGVLGCGKDGSVGLWMDASTHRIHTLPPGSWARGELLFQAGIKCGLWDIQKETWAEPMRRIPAAVPESCIHQTMLFYGVTRRWSIGWIWQPTSSTTSASLTGYPSNFPVRTSLGLNGGTNGIHLWSFNTNTHIWIPSDTPATD